MANLADSAVTVLDAYYEGGLQNKDFVTKRVQITLTGQGTATDGSRINATNFGLARIVKCGNFVKDDNTAMYFAVPSSLGHFLLLDTGAATTGAPKAVTGTLIGTVTGPPNAQY